MQGNSQLFFALEYALGLGCFNDSQKTLLDKLSAVNPDDEYSASLDSRATVLLENWETLRAHLTKYENQDVKLTDKDDAVNNYIKDMSDSEKVEYAQEGMLYSMMKELPYGDGTLLDLFKTPASDLLKEDLYPLASVMTDGQVAVVPYIGLFSMLGIISNKDVVAQTQSVVDETQKDSSEKPLSIYAGIDRTIFSDGGVALTSEADVKSKSSGDNPFYSGNINSYIETGLIMGTCASFLAASIFSVKYMISSSWADEMVAYHYVFYRTSEYTASCQLGCTSEQLMKFTYENNMKALCDRFGYTSGSTALLTIGIFLIIAGTYLGLEIFNYYNPSYDKIPRIIVDEIDSGKNTVHYINYYATKQAIDGENAKSGNEYADLNAWSGKQWNALYTTKDAKAGKPITVQSLKCKYGSRDKDSVGVHMFHEDAVYNLNRHCFSDDVNGIYLVYAHDEDALQTTATTFSSGSIALATGAGAVIGLLVGTLVTMLVYNKKKKTANSSSKTTVTDDK